MKEKGKEDKRNVWHLLLSVIKNNSTIYLVFMRKHHEDLFIMASLIILFISLYLCLNTFLLYNISMVKLYTGCISFGNFVLNIFLTSFFISIIIIVIKKFMTNKDYIYSRVINCDEYIKNKEKILKIAKSLKITALFQVIQIDLIIYQILIIILEEVWQKRN